MNVLHVMNAGGHFSPELAAELREVVQTALDLYAGQLNLDGVDVSIHFEPHWQIEELGLVGYAPSGRWVQLMVNPTNPNFHDQWRIELPLQLAHELHHAKRWQGVGYGHTLLEATVSEGLAQHFEAAARGGPPIYAAPHPDMHALWARAQTQLDGSYDHHAWFFGSEQEGLDRWAGYALGYELVRRFLEQRGGDAVTHVNTPAAEFRMAWR